MQSRFEALEVSPGTPAAFDSFDSHHLPWRRFLCAALLPSIMVCCFGGSVTPTREERIKNLPPEQQKLLAEIEQAEKELKEVEAEIPGGATSLDVIFTIRCSTSRHCSMKLGGSQRSCRSSNDVCAS